jgi:hypothetical protein
MAWTTTWIECTDAAGYPHASMDASGVLPQLVRLIRGGRFICSQLVLAFVFLSFSVVMLSQVQQL